MRSTSADGSRKETWTVVVETRSDSGIDLTSHRYARIAGDRMGRKKIRDRTKLCSALLALGIIPYSDAKKMTEDQLLSLWHFDHNILHETGHPDRDKFWNLTPMLIRPHREKTKRDAAIIAKGRRIRTKLRAAEAELAYQELIESTLFDSVGAGKGATGAPARLGPALPLRIGSDEECGEPLRRSTRHSSEPHKRKIRSRGFDKTLRKKLDGTVVKRER